MDTPPPLPPQEPTAPTPAPRRHRPEPAAKKKMAGWKIALLACGAALVLFIGMIALYMFATTEMPVEERDREVVLTAEYAAEWLEDFTPDRAHETITKLRYLDKSVELSYEYEDDHIYILSTVSVETSVSDAKAAWIGLQAGESIGQSLEDVDMRKRPDLLRFGDVSESHLIYTEEGEIAGNAFSCRSGRRIFDMYMGGLYFDDAESFREFLLPILKKFNRYEP